MPASTAKSVAELVVEFLVGHGVDRVFGLQGGHIQPIWDFLAQRGVRIVDVRDEGAAVHMAHAHAVLSGGFGVALVTAGPGVTNCVTAMANAQLERVPVLLIGGCAPVAQDDLGPLQGIAHVDIMRPVTRLARTLRVADNVLRDLDKALATAQGDGTVPGPAYVEIPTDVLRQTVPAAIVLAEYLSARPRRRLPPDPAEVERAARLLDEATRPLVMTGRGALGAGRELVALLERTGAVYLDTQESRGLVPAEHAAMVGAMRARAMQEADLVVVVGRKLDYQMGYGSPAVFGKARFLRIGDNWEELRENRRGEVELMADPALALAALAQAVTHKPPRLDVHWTSTLRSEHARRSSRYAESLASVAAGKDGHMHPNRIFAALREGAEARRDHHRRRRRHSELRAHGTRRRAPTSTPAHSAASASAFPTASPPRCSIPSGRSWSSPATAPSASTRWRSTPPSATARKPCSSSRTTPHGTSSGSTRR